MRELFYLSGSLLCILIFFAYTDAARVSCYQCNVFKNGIQDVCGLSERKMYNCTACMKSYTRSYMHDSWQSYKYISVISRYCVLKGNFLLDEGCYGVQSDQGYNKRCYCYSDWCNTGTPNTNRTHFVLIAVASLFLTVLIKKVIV